MTKRGKKLGAGKVVGLVVLGLICLGLVMTALLHGRDATLLNPKGQIAHDQSRLMIFSVSVMLTLAIPTLLLFYFFAWRFRESSHKATYDSTKSPGKFLTFFMWTLPTVFVLMLVHIMWPAAHRLDPHRQIAANVQPMTIEVVAMRWKWLFIYPDQQIATVNFVQIPTGTPIIFDLTADEAPMSSFWISHWGGQLYAMTGHSNQLNLMADSEGDVMGRSAEINGAGFAGMQFTARASTRTDFDQWVHAVQQIPNPLSRAAYEKLLTPSQNNPAAFYSAPQADFYDLVLAKYAYTHQHAGHP